MRKVGEPLAPAPSDLAEVLATERPLDSTVPFDPKMEAGFNSGEALTGDVRPTTVKATESQFITLYDFKGNDRKVKLDTLEQVMDLSKPADKRLHLRCPKCIDLPNGGLHPFSGPNACPGKPKQKFMVCPVCASNGVSKRVYETDEIIGAGNDVEDSEDPEFEAYTLPDAASRREILQGLLELHMTTFHPASAQAMYGLRREPSGNGWRVVRSR